MPTREKKTRKKPLGPVRPAGKARKEAIIEGILAGKTFYGAIKAATPPGRSFQGTAYARLRNDPEVLAAIEEALEKQEVSRARVVGSLLEISEDQRQLARDRLKAWEVLANIQNFVDEGKDKAFQRGELTVIFKGTREKK